ncbi:MAG: cytochrome c [Xanthomonadales bacterium]|nr:cytochrome c [Xanthomonadales bacterium]
MHLSATEREHLRLGMRTYLESTEVVVEALAGGKLAEVAASARKSGSAALRDTSPGTALQMPAGFLLLATDTHRRFDELASAASAGASRRDIGRQLRDILANCTACHASYRIAPE